MATRRDNNGSTAHHILSDVKRLSAEAAVLPRTGTTLWSCPPLSRQPSVTPDSQFAGPPTERQREPNTAEDVRRITTAWRGEKKRRDPGTTVKNTGGHSTSWNCQARDHIKCD